MLVKQCVLTKTQGRIAFFMFDLNKFISVLVKTPRSVRRHQYSILFYSKRKREFIVTIDTVDLWKRSLQQKPQ